MNSILALTDGTSDNKCRVAPCNYTLTVPGSTENFKDNIQSQESVTVPKALCISSNQVGIESSVQQASNERVESINSYNNAFPSQQRAFELQIVNLGNTQPSLSHLATVNVHFHETNVTTDDQRSSRAENTTLLYSSEQSVVPLPYEYRTGATTDDEAVSDDEIAPRRIASSNSTTFSETAGTRDNPSFSTTARTQVLAHTSEGSTLTSQTKGHPIRRSWAPSNPSFAWKSPQSFSHTSFSIRSYPTSSALRKSVSHYLDGSSCEALGLPTILLPESKGSSLLIDHKHNIKETNCADGKQRVSSSLDRANSNALTMRDGWKRGPFGSHCSASISTLSDVGGHLFFPTNHSLFRGGIPGGSLNVHYHRSRAIAQEDGCPLFVEAGVVFPSLTTSSGSMPPLYEPPIMSTSHYLEATSSSKMRQDNHLQPLSVEDKEPSDSVEPFDASIAGQRGDVVGSLTSDAPIFAWRNPTSVCISKEDRREQKTGKPLPLPTPLGNDDAFADPRAIRSFPNSFVSPPMMATLPSGPSVLWINNTDGKFDVPIKLRTLEQDDQPAYQPNLFGHLRDGVQSPHQTPPLGPTIKSNNPFKKTPKNTENENLFLMSSSSSVLPS